MTSDKPLRAGREPAVDPVQAARGTSAAAGSEDAGDGGDPACWARLVCQECGAVISEGHRAECSRAADTAGPPRAGS
jgi:hypothetical protein